MSNKTGKGKKTATARAEDERKREEERQLREVSVAAQIQKVLETGQMALQPFLHFSEYGIVPRVRLVDNPKEDGQESDTEEAGGDTDQHESTDAEQS